MNDHDFLPPGSRCCHCGMLAGPACLEPHEFPEGGGACVHCGTLSINVNQTACPGPQRRGEALRPEPARTQRAADDYDLIGRRLAELEAERTAAMNEPEKE